jgi:hypothetical protein
MKKKVLIFLILIIAGFLAVGQTGPSSSGGDSLRLFAGSGENQILIHEINPSAGQITVLSEDSGMLEVKQVYHIHGQPFAILLVEEKNVTGMVTLVINIDEIVRQLDIHIIHYDVRGVKYEVHDIVFWQQAVPITQSPVFDTILQVARNPHDELNWDEIPITVNLDCTTDPCWGYDFYTGFYRGYLMPPATGTYHFYMESDNDCALWLSTNNMVNNATAIIYRGDSAKNVGENVGNKRTKSAPVELEEGKVYAFYATQWIIHNPYGGILWEGPHNSQPEFIQGQYMMPLYNTIKPGIPGNLHLLWRAFDQAHIGWETPAGNFKIAGYNIYIDGVRHNDDPVSGISYTIQGLSEATPYFVVITAVDWSGNESFLSEVIQFETYPEDNNPPTPPDNLIVLKATGLAVHVQWSGATDAETEVIGYNLYVDDVLYNLNDYIFSDSLIIHDLEPDTGYTITIESIDAGYNISEISEPFIVSTVGFDPLGPDLGEKRGRVIIHDQQISWNDGIGLNGPYENGSMVNDSEIRKLVSEFEPGAIRWGAITANSKSFQGSVGPGKVNTYGRMLNFANELDAWFALTVGVQDGIDYITDPETFLHLLEYLAGDEKTTWGAVRASEGFTEPLLQAGKGILLEFGNEVWGASVHDAQIGSNYENYAAWVREMSDVVRSSPYYDPDRIIMVSSGRNPHPSSSYNVNNRVLTGDKGHVECLGVSGYLGGNLNYDPEIPPGESELDYYKNGIARAKYNLDGFVLTMQDMFKLTETLKTFYLYESNMTTTSYNGRLGQAVIMTDYMASSMKYGSIVPSIFHLTGGQWRITRPTENHRKLPLYYTGQYFNKFCKGHVLKTSFITNNIITESDGKVINWEPVGAYAYNKEDRFSILLINRDFTDSYTVEIVLPDNMDILANAKIYTLWEDDFSSYDINIDSAAITLESGMLVKVPRHGIVIITSGVTDPEFEALPLGYFDRIRPDSLYVYFEKTGVIDSHRGTESIWAFAYPANSFSRAIKFEVIEDETEDTSLNFFQNRLHFRASGICDDEGFVRVRVGAADNPEVSVIKELYITNQGLDCPVSTAKTTEGLEGVLLYPNPAGEILYLNRSVGDRALIEIFDISGQLIVKESINEDFNIKTGSLKPGLYLINILSGNGNRHQGRFTKQ